MKLKSVSKTGIIFILFILLFVISSCGSKTDNSSNDSSVNPSNIDGNTSNSTDDSSKKEDESKDKDEQKINIAEYIDGATFIYKSNSLSSEKKEEVKNIFIGKINEILNIVNSYTNYAFTELDSKQILLKYLIDTYNLDQINNLDSLDSNELDELINSYIQFVDHYGLLSYEEDNLNKAILDTIGESNISSDETLYNNADGINGFGAEKYNEIIDTTTYTINNFDMNKVEDLNNNGKFDLWTKETFIAKGLCTEETYNEEDYCYAISVDTNIELKAKGISKTYDILEYVKNSGLNNYKFYFFTEKVTGKVLINGQVIENYIPKYIELDDENSHVIIKNSDEVVLNPALLAYTNNKKFELLDNRYVFDTTKDTNFKNYKNVVKTCVENVSNNWSKEPFIIVNQLTLNELSIDVTSTELFNSNILINNAESNVTLVGLILDTKKEINLNKIKVLFESSSNNEITIGGYLYNTEDYKLLNLGSFNISGGAASLEKTITIDFENDKITLSEHKTKTDKNMYVIEEKLNQNSFNIKYNDESSSYIMLTFDSKEQYKFSIIDFELEIS